MSIDRHSREWLLVKSRIEERILANKAMLEADFDETATAKMRGAIFELRSLLAWGEASD